jgi:hypothetical protein
MATSPKGRSRDRPPQPQMLLFAAQPQPQRQSALWQPEWTLTRTKPRHGRSRAQSALFRTWLQLLLRLRTSFISPARTALTLATGPVALTARVATVPNLNRSDGTVTRPGLDKWAYRVESA